MKQGLNSTLHSFGETYILVRKGKLLQPSDVSGSHGSTITDIVVLVIHAANASEMSVNWHQTTWPHVTQKAVFSYNGSNNTITYSHCLCCPRLTALSCGSNIWFIMLNNYRMPHVKPALLTR